MGAFDRGHHAEEFHALSLLLQHRKLLAELQELEQALERPEGEIEDEWRAVLVAVLDRFVGDLAAHFVTEARSTNDVFGDDPDPRRLQELRRLEREHPGLLRDFRHVLELTKNERMPHSAIVGPLQQAISAFRIHEEREDALFSED